MASTPPATAASREEPDSNANDHPAPPTAGAPEGDAPEPGTPADYSRVLEEQVSEVLEPPGGGALQAIGVTAAAQAGAETAANTVTAANAGTAASAPGTPNEESAAEPTAVLAVEDAARAGTLAAVAVEPSPDAPAVDDAKAPGAAHEASPSAASSKVRPAVPTAGGATRDDVDAQDASSGATARQVDLDAAMAEPPEAENDDVESADGGGGAAAPSPSRDQRSHVPPLDRVAANEEANDDADAGSRAKRLRESVEPTAAADPEAEGPAAASIKAGPKRPRLDGELKRRGQRLFGVVLGTLNKAAAKSKTEADLKREEVDRRLHDRIQQENQEVAEKVRQETEVRKARLQEIRAREDERRAAFCKLVYRNQTANLSNFLKTKTGPPIYFLPAKSNARIAAVLASQKAQVGEIAMAAEETPKPDSIIMAASLGAAREDDSEVPGGDVKDEAMMLDDHNDAEPVVGDVE
ncbi:hypothetical protein HK405_005022 [Cladochytrium tenue]|nr:hypothetical protein HK405_005022 [Cladochytrium tenue]